MKKHPAISFLFYTSMVYDALLGLLLLLVPLTIYHLLNETPPNHFGYVQFPAALLLVFAWMFWNAAREPQRNRNTIPYMIMFKLAFAIIVIGYWITSSVPSMWKPFAIIDLVFAAAFFLAYQILNRPLVR